MGNELQKGLAQRAKEFLHTDEEHSLFELAELLRQFRNETHPDKFQDNELKGKAEVRFKAAQSLLDEIEMQMEADRFNRTPWELAIYKPLYDAAKFQADLDRIKKELKDTNYELDNERENNDDLRKQLQQKNADSLSTEIQYLQSLYRPTTREFASIGLAIILSGALGVMTQMEKVSVILEKYSPFAKHYISTGLFVCLVLLLAEMLRKLWERRYIKRKSEEVCSPRCAHDFLQYLKGHRAGDAPIIEFSEIEAFDFISGQRNWLKNVVSFLGFQIFWRGTVNLLKDIFIHNLLNKKLVDVSMADGMQRSFRISSTRASHLEYYEYMEEQKQKVAAKSTKASD